MPTARKIFGVKVETV